ncbi:hypothetical protein [Sporosalibacterium faouarense]|uniref:hypothetical protein n=1 Tax=Sporosalibacterium faouarense TaxID=516123 RepID=UPI00192B4522|nr:hypothetical protein [Sporosalibacterium faouarense]
MERSIKRIILSVIVISVLSPLVIEFMILRNNFVSVVSNQSWLSFIGSFYGSIIGGIATLIAVMLSIKQTNRIQQKEDERRYIEKIESNKPIFNFPIDDRKVLIRHEYGLKNSGESDHPYFHYNVLLENIGMGIAYDFYSFFQGDNYSGIAGENIFVQKGQQISIQICGIQENSRVEDRVKLNLAFKDLYQNVYIQRMDFVVDYSQGIFVIRKAHLPELVEKNHHKSTSEVYDRCMNFR